MIAGCWVESFAQAIKSKELKIILGGEDNREKCAKA